MTFLRFILSTFSPISAISWGFPMSMTLALWSSTVQCPTGGYKVLLAKGFSIFSFSTNLGGGL
jgi:hypothetical protein